jgi:hypothetical protein
MNNTQALPQPDEIDALESGEDLAKKALAAASVVNGASDEAAASDEVAQTLMSLQNLIERNANQLARLNDQLKEKREMLKNIYENDVELASAEEAAKVVTEQLKERKAKLKADPQSTQLQVMIGEINQEKKEIEEALSGELVSYYQLTNSTSFDTSDGDQWEFNIKAKVKPRKKSGGGDE